MVSDTRSRRSIPHTAATSPKARCRVRAGATVALSIAAAMSAAEPRYRWETIRGLPPTRADSTR